MLIFHEMYNQHRKNMKQINLPPNWNEDRKFHNHAYFDSDLDFWFCYHRGYSNKLNWIYLKLGLFSPIQKKNKSYDLLSLCGCMRQIKISINRFNVHHVFILENIASMSKFKVCARIVYHSVSLYVYVCMSRRRKWNDNSFWRTLPA